MITIKDLKDKAQREPCTPNAALHLDDDAVAPGAVVRLAEYFREDESRRCVSLVIRGEESGCLGREAVRSLSARVRAFPEFKPPAKQWLGMERLDVGEADHSILPGNPKLFPIKLRCPEKGCGYIVFVGSYSEDNPPMCKKHPGTPMEPAK